MSPFVRVVNFKKISEKAIGAKHKTGEGLAQLQEYKLKLTILENYMGQQLKLRLPQQYRFSNTNCISLGQRTASRHPKFDRFYAA